MRVMNGGHPPSSGLCLGSRLCKALWAMVGEGGRTWWSGGWLWAKGRGAVARMRHAKVDFGPTARFVVPSAPLRRVRVDDYAMLLPDRLAIYDGQDDCLRREDCAPMQAQLKWEQYMDPVERVSVGHVGVDAVGLARAMDVMACLDPHVAIACERIEGAHGIVRAYARNEEWEAEAIAFASEELDPGERRSMRWRR